MRGLLYLLSALSVIGLAVWAYNENHKTQQAMAELRELHREIQSLREAIGVQRAEWAYLSRPERLQELTKMNFMRMRLLPLSGAQYGRIEEVAYPMPAALDDPTEDEEPPL
ncbi:cell division protein FtsL [Pararhodobacter sp. SW119]|uniref:cell division protein FtsL n=1 Tax=Pararhodobacter sp. SW119 TaxID=2780075 RepID=UPI001AE04D6D|nr:cell division protein FtsL [Pararhodobacter sp. SW119]